MKEVDQLLEDAALVESVYEAQGKRHRKSRTHGRTQTPAEVVLRLLILKHVRNWSYDTLEREVRANLAYRAFTRIGDEKVPDAKTLARLGQVIGPEVIGELHERLMELARERGVVQGRKMRVDTTSTGFPTTGCRGRATLAPVRARTPNGSRRHGFLQSKE
jgi:IS5 family transposase